MQESAKPNDAAEAGGCPAGIALSPRARVLRLLPLAGLVAFLALAFWQGWFGLLTLENIAMAHERWHIMLQEHRWLAVFAYTCLYVAVGAFCVPGGALLTAAGGLAFGVVLASFATVLGATIGALILFLSARTACSEWLARTEGPWLRTLREGFERNALSYLLFLRLVPAFPFAAVNLAAALLGMRLSTYVAATALGIVPATFAYSIAGSGLASIVEAQSAVFKQCVASSPSPDGSDCHLSLHASDLITRELVVALAALSLIALIPAARNFWSKRNAAGKGRSRPVDRQAGG